MWAMFRKWTHFHKLRKRGSMPLLQGAGHIRKNCKQRAMDYPTPTNPTQAWALPKQRRPQLTNVTHTPRKTVEQSNKTPRKTNNMENKTLDNTGKVINYNEEQLAEKQTSEKPLIELTRNDTVCEFSSSASDLHNTKELSDWSTCEDVLSPLKSPQEDLQPEKPPKDGVQTEPPLKGVQQKKRNKPVGLRFTSTIGNTPYHSKSKGHDYVKVMVRNIEYPDSIDSTVF
uniref:uncharacterized protein LOC120344639 n=1 Tax=Styela clava TaxID=7725 RepID=UPI00193935E5|nr:uncharacterized protein LOC120344639 [Styela clava]